MAGERRPDGDFRRLEVADFPDHDDVGVLTQDGPEGAGKGQPDFRADIALVDSGHFVFDRILHGDDPLVNGVDFVEIGVERCGFSRAGRAGDQDDPVGLLNDLADDLFIAFAQAKLAEPDEFLAAHEEAQAYAFPVGGGQGGDADVNVLALDPHADTAILRQALLGDIHVRHDLDARNDGGLEPGQLRRERGLVEDAVHAVADTELVFHGLHVDIRRAFLVGLPDDLVHETDNGRFLIQLAQIGLHQGFVGGDLNTMVILHQLFHRVGADAVELLGGVGDVAQEGQRQLDAHAGGQAQGIHEARVEGVVGGHHQGVVLNGVGDDVVLEDGPGGQFLQDGRINGQGAEPEEGEVQHRGQRLQEGLLGGEPLRHGGAGQGDVILLGLLEQGGDLGLGEHARPLE